MCDERRWLYAAIGFKTNEFPHFRPVQIRKTQITVPFFQEVQQIAWVSRATILVNGILYLKAALL